MQDLIGRARGRFQIIEERGRGGMAVVFKAYDSVLFLVTSDELEYPLREGQVTIGRETSNHIVLPVRQVSRHHALVHCGPSGCSIMDLRSTNGTFVNDLATPPRTQQPIRVGDVLQIGTVMLKVTRPPRSGLPSMRTTDIELKAD